MSIFVHGGDSVFLGGSVSLIPDEIALASSNPHWAARSIEKNPANRYVLGKYAQADNPNNNNQFWAHDQLVFGQPSIKNSPMNMLHKHRHIVGAFIDTEMVYPTQAAATDGSTNPFIEALGVFWKARFQEELVYVERAHDEGKLFFSMECVASEMELVTPEGVSETFEYKGMTDPSYGEFNDPKNIRKFIQPHFIGGALILPPAEPGWSEAEVEALARYSDEHSDMAQDVYTSLAYDAPQLSESDLEQITLSYMSSAMRADSTQELIKEDNVTNNIDEEHYAHSNGGDINVSDTVKTYSEAEVKAAVAEATSEIKAEIEDLKASATAEAHEAAIAEINEAHETAVAELRVELDAAVLKAEEATAERDAFVSWLTEEAEAAAEAARAEAVREERLAKVEEVASFPAEYVEANAERWSGMTEDAFADYLVDIQTVQEAKAAKEEASSEEEAETEVATAMNHVTDESDGEETFETSYASVMADRSWKDAV